MEAALGARWSIPPGETCAITEDALLCGPRDGLFGVQASMGWRLSSQLSVGPVAGLQASESSIARRTLLLTAAALDFHPMRGVAELRLVGRAGLLTLWDRVTSVGEKSLHGPVVEGSGSLTAWLFHDLGLAVYGGAGLAWFASAPEPFDYAAGLWWHWGAHVSWQF